MCRYPWLCLVVLSFACLDAPPSSEQGTALEPLIVLRGGTLIDGTDAAPRPDQSVVLRGELIEWVGASDELEIPEGATVHEVGGKFLIPGLIDSHAHLDAPMVFGLTEEEHAATVAHTFKAYLYNGVTTVLNLSSDLDWILSSREAQKRSELVGPRIFACGRSFTPEGGWGSRHGGALTSQAMALDQLEMYQSRGVDGIKIIYEDGLGGTGTYEKMPLEWLRELARTAESSAIPVYIHAINRAEFLDVIDAHPEAIVHGCEDPLSEDDISRLVDAGTAVIPTLSLWRSFTNLQDAEVREEALADPHLRASVPSFILDRMRDESYLADQREQFLAVARIDAYGWAAEKIPIFEENTALMLERGVAIGAGTDGGGPVGFNFQGYNLPYELELLVSAGLSPHQAIQSATLVNAQILGAQNHLGSIEMGKIADLLVLNADPLADIRALRDIDMLIQSGNILDRQSLAWSDIH